MIRNCDALLLASLFLIHGNILWLYTLIMEINRTYITEILVYKSALLNQSL